MQTKICTKCKEEKPISEFVKNKKGKYGVRSVCKNCTKKIMKKYNGKYKEQQKQYRQDNKEKIKEYHQKLEVKEQQKQYYQNNKEEILKQQKQDRKNNKLKYALKDRLKIAKIKTKFTIEQLLDCDLIWYKQHLESLFKSGMSWENHGNGIDKWQIDHILPLSMFDLTIPKNQLICFNYINTRPLWKSENIAKRNSIDKKLEKIKGL